MKKFLDFYLADLLAVFEMNLDLKPYHINCLGIPQERIVARLGDAGEKIRDHSADLAALPNPLNSNLAKGFTVPQAAKK